MYWNFPTPEAYNQYFKVRGNAYYLGGGLGLNNDERDSSYLVV
jgi:hypothetical protein